MGKHGMAWHIMGVTYSSKDTEKAFDLIVRVGAVIVRATRTTVALF